MPEQCIRCGHNEKAKGDYCHYCYYFVQNMRTPITEAWYWPLVNEQMTDGEFLGNTNKVPCRFLSDKATPPAMIVLVYPDGSTRRSTPGNVYTNRKVYKHAPIEIKLLKDHELFDLVDIQMTLEEEGYDPSDRGIGASSHVYYTCVNNYCGEYHRATAYEFTSKMKGRCRTCSGIDRGIAYGETMKTNRQNKVLNVPTLDTLEYVTTNEKCKVKCKICGEVFEANRSNLKAGYRNFNSNGCITCHRQRLTEKSSLFEKSVGEFISTLRIEFETQKSFTGSKRCADFYFPTLNLVIEADGSYYHSKNISYDKKFDFVNTTIHYRTLGLRTVHVLDYQWFQNRSLIESKLKAILMVSRKPSARKPILIVKEDSNPKIRNFYKAHHFMGVGKLSSANYCVYDKRDVLIAVCSFSQHRYTDEDNDLWELTRFASTHKIYNILPRILEMLKKDYPHIKRIESYADLCWTDIDANFYTKNGFRFVRDTMQTPGYVWIKNNIVLDRHKTQRKLLNSMFGVDYSKEWSESDIMEDNMFHQVFNCGNAVYELEL